MNDDPSPAPVLADEKNTDVPPPAAHRGRLWAWFAAGFLAVFIGMALMVTMHPMHPSGRAVLECKLWKYYVIEIPRLFGPSNLGPATGGSSAMLTTAFQHVLFSAIGGAGALGLGWGVRRLSSRESQAH